MLQRFSTGAGTEARTAASAWLQRWLPSASPVGKRRVRNLSGADAAQAFSKLALTGAGSQERSVLGNRGGFQAIRMFQAANPSINLQDATNKSILDMQLISNQANQDYSQAALSHFADNEKKFCTDPSIRLAGAVRSTVEPATLPAGLCGSDGRGWLASRHRNGPKD